MKAVAYVMRSQIRSLVAPMLFLSAVVAAVFAVVITFAAGARRTDTLAPRVDAAIGGAFDYLLTQQAGGPLLTDAVSPLPGVESADSYTFVFGGLAPIGGDPVNASIFAGSERALGARVVEGRALDKMVDDEFVASPSFVAATGAAVGDRFQLYTITQDQAADSEFGVSNNGPTLDATMVGVIDSPSMIEDPSPFAMFSSKLLDRGEIGHADTMIAVRVEPDTDEQALRRELATLPGGGQVSIDSGSLISDDMQRAIRTQARGTWLLALFAGIAAIASLTQLTSRQVRPTAGERQTMTAIGFTHGQVLTSAMARAVPPIVFGGLAGAALAVPFSSLFPTGVVGRFEPAPGVLVQWPVLIACTAALVATLLACTAIVLALTPVRVGTVVPSPVVDAIAVRSPLLPAAVGIRLGFTRARGERGSMRAAFAGILLTVSGLVGAITFGVSLDRLIDEPFRYGWNVDANLGDNGGERIKEELAHALEADPNVESLVYYAQDFATAGDTSVAVMGMNPVRGDVLPLVLDGRLPVAADEIALGRVTARRVGAGIGDGVTLVGVRGTQTFRVVGLAVLTGFGRNEGIGQGAVATLDGLHQISDAQVTNAAVDFRVPREQAIVPYLEQFDSAFVGDDYVPAAITSLVRVRLIPFVLAGLLALLAVLTITHMLLTSLRARQRDLAVVQALGAAPGFVSRAVHWQATLVTLVPAIVGVPLGFIVGRQVFVALARGIGAVDQVDYPLLLVGVVVVAVVALANVVAIWPARKARRWRPAAALAAE